MDLRSSGGGDALDQSIHRLLGEIGQRRRQAAHFAQLVEQSIYQTPATHRTGRISSWPPGAAADAPSIDGALPEGRFVGDLLADEDERARSASPPASFLEDFTRNFVDTYQPPPDAAAHSPPGTSGTGRFRRMVLRAQAARQQPAPYVAPGLGYPESPDPGYTPSARDYAASAESSFSEPSVPGHYSSGPRAPAPQSPEPGIPAPRSPEPGLRGVAVIDRAARARMWQRLEEGGQASRDGGRDEERIQAIVQLAERIAALQTAAAAPRASPPPASASLPPSPDARLRSDPGAHQAGAPQPGGPAEHSEADAPLPCWAAGEWERWAAHAQAHPAAAAAGGRALGSAEMVQRLDWAHAEQAWQHGFNDALVGGGAKLRRTYRDLPLELHAYPDGNVKRTASARHPTSGARCTATTLYFANGDWSCVVAPGGRCGAESYYYYCAERVWHEQRDGAVLYRFPDGREEHTDPHGARTVRYPSGDVRVVLGPPPER
ncbi:hypothetical protein H4R18_003945 [Coemansia javaensis]|uniref:Centromere protein J C-terminal domain-containing protein n=1 Tax=Coemansia javaensis TaxID=2761396 RepID=A0A9W8HAT5_9FUNG|nr:hypothetical protein H4R18_003945 [Coemansia javaensis]